MPEKIEPAAEKPSDETTAYIRGLEARVHALETTNNQLQSYLREGQQAYAALAAFLGERVSVSVEDRPDNRYLRRFSAEMLMSERLVFAAKASRVAILNTIAKTLLDQLLISMEEGADVDPERVAPRRRHATLEHKIPHPWRVTMEEQP